jgi:hypothetical protein
MKQETEQNFYHGHTRKAIVNAIIDFELDNDILPDWREILQYGWAGYEYTDDDVLRELYDEYFTETEHQAPENPEDWWAFDTDGNATDGRGNHV